MINLKGMSIQDLLEFDPNELSKLNRSDLAKIVTKLNSAANKRIKRAKATDTGIYSPALVSQARKQHKILDAGELPHFSVKDKSLNELRRQYIQTRGFLKAKTSTHKGFMEFRKKQIEILGPNIVKSKETESMFWKAYTKFMQDEHNEVFYPSDGSYNQVIEWMKNNIDFSQLTTEDEILDALHKELERDDIREKEKFTKGTTRNKNLEEDFEYDKDNIWGDLFGW